MCGYRNKYDAAGSVRHSQESVYDALVVCNGHYSAPRCPDVEGSDTFPGRVMHSHNYRVNQAYKGQVVVIVGASASGEDICREIAEVAHQVRVSKVQGRVSSLAW